MTRQPSGPKGRSSDPRSDAPAVRKPSRRSVLGRLLGASTVLGTGLTGTATARERGNETDGDETDDGGEPDGDASAADVTFRNQSMDGSRVTVESVRVPEGGYVAMYDSILLEGGELVDEELSSAITGVSEVLQPGEHADVEFLLFDIPGIEFESGELHSDQWLVAVLHRETNGNDAYDFVVSDEDGPYVEEGAPIADVAYMTIQDGDGF